MHEFDIVIIGGGVAGLSLAVSLADTELSIAILEAREFQMSQQGQHARVSAYNLASQKLFTQLGVWDQIPAENKGVFQHISVWDDAGNGQINFDCTDIAKSALGHIIQNEAVVKALRAQLTEHKNLHLFCPQPAQSVEFNHDAAIVHCADKIFTAKLIVGADGANSWLRSQLQVPMEQAAYGSSALIANVRTELAHNNTARQVFLSDGPFAFLPLADPHVCSIVWSTTPDEAKQLQQLDSSELCQRLTRATGGRLGQVIERLDQPLVFPLMMRHVNHYVGPRWALIGDAAHTLHPLAGQGINLGIQDVQSLTSVIRDTLSASRDIGLMQNLRPFERSRKGDNQMMISAMQGFKTLFGTELPIIKSARSFGLNMVDGTRLLKNLFIRRATGLKH